MLEQGELAMFDAHTGERLHSETERANEAERRAKALSEELARLQEAAKKANGDTFRAR